MSEPFVYDPRCILCKDPYGAVLCGTEIAFHCRPLISEGFTRCAITLRHEFSGKAEVHLLTCLGPEDDRTHFTVSLPASDIPELVWYHFSFWREDYFACDLDKTGYRSDGKIEPWQLTVYGESHTPEWFGEGVTYQIFPDRFCALTPSDPTGLVGNRWMQENWDDVPEWRPDPDGEIRNRNFFGGQLAGITSKLDDLKQMGVSTLYLCPIFESASNHRYNTADYSKIDPMLGTEEDFRTLCAEAKQRDMRVILDGVFNHIGSQSLYFNADGFYPTLGAAQSKDSPWYKWFRFTKWPTDYESWWGIKTLPAVEETDESYMDFIFGEKDSIVRHWLNCGADGWRLDVADELPDEFIADLRLAMEETKPDSLLLGEVWEDGTTKIAYSRRRKYLLGSETHGLMNYPFRTAAINWLTGGDAAAFMETMETIRENYPPQAFYSCLNILGTHDTPRILTLLGTVGKPAPDTKSQRAAYRLSAEELRTGLARLRLAAMLAFSFPGSPTVFYGDEAGMQGFEDPLNRGTYPWGREDLKLIAFYQKLGALRDEHRQLQRGDIEYLFAKDGGLVFRRSLDGCTAVTALNAGKDPLALTIPWAGDCATDAISGQRFCVRDGLLHLCLDGLEGMILI